MNKKYIAVIGSGENVPAGVLKDAEELGRRIAQAGMILVCGGRKGVMEAACRGAKSAGGLTIGILPGLSRGDANPFVDIAIPTGLGYALRNFLTIRSADAVIMLHGEVGTLSEAVLAYQHAKPLIVLETTGGWSERLRSVALEDGAYLDSRHLMHIHYAKNPEEAVALAIRLMGAFAAPDKI